MSHTKDGNVSSVEFEFKFHWLSKLFQSLFDVEVMWKAYRKKPNLTTGLLVFPRGALLSGLIMKHLLDQH